MLPIGIFSLWTISFQVTLCLSPHALIAIAHLQTQRARAHINALNFRTRAQMNAARARANMNLGHLGSERRLIRDADESFPEDVPEPAKIVFQDNNEEDNAKVDVHGGSFKVDERIGLQSPYPENDGEDGGNSFLIDETVGLKSPYQDYDGQKLGPCLIEDQPGSGAGYNQGIDIRRSDIDDDTLERDAGSQHVEPPICPVCRQGLGEPNKDVNGSNANHPSCPVCGKSLRSEDTDSGVLRQTEDSFEDVEAENLPELEQDFSVPPENFMEEDPSANEDFSIMNPEDERTARSHPRHHSHKHGFVHTHGHFHEIRPVYETTATVPTSKVHGFYHQTAVLPGSGFVQPSGGVQGTFSQPSNINIINTNSQGFSGGISPHQGITSHTVLNHGTTYGTSPFVTTGTMGHGTIASQTQTINAHSLPITVSQHQGQAIQTQSVSTSMNQNHAISTGVGFGNQGIHEFVSSPLAKDENGDGERNDEMVSTFLLPTIHIDTPSYPAYPSAYSSPQNFDPSKAQNRQDIVKYIEDDQKSVQELLRFLETSNQRNLNYYGYQQPFTAPKINNYQLHKKDYHPHGKLEDDANKGDYDKQDSDGKGYQHYRDQNEDHHDAEQSADYTYLNDHDNDNDHDDNYQNHGNDDKSVSDYDIHQEDNTEQSGTDAGEYETDLYHDRSTHVKDRSKYNSKNKDAIVGSDLGELDMPAWNNIPLPPHMPEPFGPNAMNPDMTDAQKLLRNYYETEQRNVQRAIEEVQEEHKRNLENLLSLLRENNDERFDAKPVERNPERQENLPGDRLGEPDPAFMEEGPVGVSESQDMLGKLLENDQGIQEQIGLGANDEPRLGNIFRVQKQPVEFYHRQERSVDSNDSDNLILKEEKMLKQLKKEARTEEDLAFLSHLGGSMLNDLKRKLMKKRTRRQTNGHFNLKRLLNDPKLKLDVEKTLNNVGAATKNAFDYKRAPIYHVKNMVGSAKDAVMAAMKIPNQPVVVPSSYDIVNSDGYIVRGNQKVLSAERGANDEFGNTFKKVGSIIRNSVKSGQEALGHVNEAATHAKKAIYSVRYATPRIILQKLPSIARQPVKEALLIVPKIFDFTTEDTSSIPKLDSRVGAAREESDGDVVGVSNLLDAVGASTPTSSNLELQKIVMQPRNLPTVLQARNGQRSEEPSNGLDDFLGSVRVESMGNIDEQYVGDALNNLYEAQASFGVNSLRGLLSTVKRDLQKMLQNTLLGSQMRRRKHKTSKNGRKQQIIPTANGEIQKNIDIPQRTTKTTIKDKPDQNPDERVGAGLFLPEELTHPFMNRASDTQLKEFFREYQTSLKKKTEPEMPGKDEHVGAILGAINPVMFERIFNETVKAKNNATPYEVFHHHHEGRTHGKHPVSDEDEKVSTMEIKGQVLKPFMGVATKKNEQDFFSKYAPNTNSNVEPQQLDITYDIPSSIEYESAEETASEYNR